MLHGLRGHVRVPRAPLGAAGGDLAVGAPARAALLAGISQGPFCPVPEEGPPCAPGSPARTGKSGDFSVKGTLAPSLLLVFASALLCVHSRGHLLVVPPALSQQFQRGPVGPVCTWRAWAPVPSPGHRHHQCWCERPLGGVWCPGADLEGASPSCTVPSGAPPAPAPALGKRWAPPADALHCHQALHSTLGHQVLAQPTHCPLYVTLRGVLSPRPSFRVTGVHLAGC